MRIPRRFLASLIATALLTMTAAPEMSRAESEIEQVAPTVLIQRRQQSLSSPGYGTWWDLALPTPPSSYVEFFETDSMGNKSSDSILCAGFEDPLCAARPNTRMMSVAALGRCLDADDIACIEGIRLRVGTEEMADLEFISYLGPETAFAQSMSLNLPRGSSISRWRDKSGAEYGVIASITSTLSVPSTGAAWGLAGQETIINVSRLASSACNCPYQFYIAPAQALKIPEYQHKVISNPNGSTPAIEFKPSTRIELSVRLPNTITGWFNGRIAAGTVTSRPLANSRTSYTFSADAANTYVAGGAFPASSAPSDFMTKVMGRPWEAPRSFGNAPGGIGVIDKYNQWAPYLGDKALVTQSRWTIRGTTWSTDSCFSGGKGISALLATNAAVYDGLPPAWDSRAKSLSFKVASPHYDDKGAVAIGNYTLALPSAAVSCLYGRASLPLYAKIEVTESKDGQNFSAVSALSESGGWVNFSASGFHFSEPTIKLTFTDNPTGAGQGLDVYLAKDKVETSITPARFVKTTVKGQRAALSITLDKAQTIKIYRKIGKKITLLKTLKARKGSNTFSTTFKTNYSFLVRDSRGKVITPLASSSSFRLGDRHVA